MKNMDTNYFKKKLEAEKALLENELKGFAIKSETNPDDWESIPADTDNIETRDEVADRMEDMSERKATEIPLENQLEKVNEAIEMIEKGTYGVCVVCGKEIENDRLEASPSAKTCKEHREQE